MTAHNRLLHSVARHSNSESTDCDLPLSRLIAAAGWGESQVTTVRDSDPPPRPARRHRLTVATETPRRVAVCA
jgi:hypothetical protein